MPLPANGTLSLQGHAGPGVTQQSKPKQAMIVRMSAETFEALESQSNPPRIEVEMGKRPVCHLSIIFRVFVTEAV